MTGNEPSSLYIIQTLFRLFRHYRLFLSQQKKGKGKSNSLHSRGKKKSIKVTILQYQVEKQNN